MNTTITKINEYSQCNVDYSLREHEEKRKYSVFINSLNNIIVDIICRYFNYDKQLLFVKTRVREVKDKRFICMYFMNKYKKYTKSNLGNIVNYFGLINHATGINAVRRVKEFIDTEEGYKEDINKISGAISIYFDNLHK